MPADRPSVTTAWPEPFEPDGVRVGADDRSLVLYVGSADPISPVESACWGHYEPQATWADDHLQIDLYYSQNAEPDRSRHELCFPPAPRFATVTMDRPLGSAPVAHGTHTLIVFRARELLVPTWLPDGWTFANEHGSQDPAADWSFEFQPAAAALPDPHLFVRTWAAPDPPTGAVGPNPESVTVRGTPGSLDIYDGNPERHVPASVWLTWVENQHARAVGVDVLDAVAEARAICLRVAESLVPPT